MTYLYTCEWLSWRNYSFIFIPPSLLIVHICVSGHQCHQEDMLRSSCPSVPHLCRHVIQKVKDAWFHFIAKNSLFIIIIIIILFSVIWLLCFVCVCVCVWLFIYMCGVLAWWFHSLCGGQPHILGVMNEHWDINCVSISVCVAVFVSCDLSCFCSLAWLTSAAAVIWTHSAPSACSGGCPAPPVYPHGAFGQWRRRCGRGCSRPSGFSEWSLLLRVDIAPSPAWRMRRRTRLAFAADWAADCAAPLQTENKPIREREGGVNRWRLELFVSKEMLWLHPKAFCAVYSPSPPQSTQERADWLSHIYSWLVKVGKGRSYS